MKLIQIPHQYQLLYININPPINIHSYLSTATARNEAHCEQPVQPLIYSHTHLPTPTDNSHTHTHLPTPTDNSHTHTHCSDLRPPMHSWAHQKLSNRKMSHSLTCTQCKLFNSTHKFGFVHSAMILKKEVCNQTMSSCCKHESSRRADLIPDFFLPEAHFCN